MASMEPGIARHSDGDLMYWSLSKLMTPSRSRMASFIASRRELGYVRHPVHLELELEEQVQPLLAHVGILGHHHDAVEKRIDGRAQDSEALQVVGVVALLELRRGLRGRLAKGMVEVALHLLGKVVVVDEAELLALVVRLLDDVRDALVRGGEARGLRKRGEHAHGLELLRQQVEPVGLGFD